MVVGKTNNSISKAEIFSVFKETEVLSSVFPEVRSLPCLINSPLRVDNNPSFSLFVDSKEHVRYKDFATGDKGGLLDLLCKYWNCTFSQCLEKISEMLIGKGNITIKPRQIRTFRRKESGSLTTIQVAVRPWRDYDYEYWASYGVEKKWLHYAEIYPISYKIITKKDSPKDKGKKYIFPADKYAYVYCERKGGKLSLKVYQPYNTKGYKWCSKMDKSVVGLWAKIPEYGDKVVICSSIKDALCLSCQCSIPTLCLQGEGYSMNDTAIKELKRRYKNIYICFDTDKWGRQDAVRLSCETGFLNVVPDLGECKDLSDSYKKYGKEWFQRNIGTCFA